MFARALLCFHLSPLPRPILAFTTLGLFPPSASLLFNRLRTLSFSVAHLSPVSPALSALFPQKPGGVAPLVRPISWFSYEVRSFLFALGCRLSTVDCRLPTISFPCVSYAKTGWYPSWSYQFPSSHSNLNAHLTPIIPTLAGPSPNSNHSRTYKIPRGASPIRCFVTSLLRILHRSSLFTAHSQSCYRTFTHLSPFLGTMFPSQGSNSYTMPIAIPMPTVHFYRCEPSREIPS
jgi:hypothetical protein